MHCRPWFLQAFSISKQSSNSDRFFGNCCIGDKTMNFCFKILNMQVKKDTFNCWFLFQRYLTAGIIYIKLFLNFGYGRKSVMTLPHLVQSTYMFSAHSQVRFIHTQSSSAFFPDKCNTFERRCRWVPACRVPACQPLPVFRLGNHPTLKFNTP